MCVSNNIRYLKFVVGMLYVSIYYLLIKLRGERNNCTKKEEKEEGQDDGSGLNRYSIIVQGKH